MSIFMKFALFETSLSLVASQLCHAYKVCCVYVSLSVVYCPGSNPSGDEIFSPSRPALGPTQPPVQWIRDLSWW